ncbi:unnamed protein product [Lepidochelys olivacea]
MSKNAVFVKRVRILVTCSEDRFSHSDWKHIHQACSRHETSKVHAMAFTNYVSYKQCQLSGRGNILNQLNREAMNTRLIGTDGEHIKGMLDIVLFCAKQQIALHGHREDQEALNKGNFLELFKLLSKYDEEIQSLLEMFPKNATMVSPDIQNELLEAAASLLLCKIRKELHEALNTYYAIPADECKDFSKHELIAVCVRYLHTGVI